MVNVTYDASGAIISYYQGEDSPVVYNPGDIAIVFAGAALVFIMTPGVGFFYSGLLRRKNALSMLLLSMGVFAVVSFQFFFWGFSLAFSDTANSFIGDLRHFGFMDVDIQQSMGSPKVPSLIYAFFQLMFATLTPMLMLGAAAERGRIGPVLVFAFIWATLVYDPVACWTWNSNGWGYKWGVLDFAGGGPVHMTSGVGALAYSLWLGKRRGYGTPMLAFKPNNTMNVVLGTVLLWFGWFGFNGVSALGANLRMAMACMVTNTAAATGGLTWMLLDWRLERKFSAVGFCSGAVAGLVGITPASGYVGLPASVAIGIVTSAACNLATNIKFLLRIDDALDIFAVHGVGGFVGNILTAFFADSRIASFDGFSEIDGGWINHNWKQLYKQFANSVAIFAYAFCVTLFICVVMDYIPGLSLRADEDSEIVGIDDAEIGELGYDYAWLERDLEGSYQNKAHPHWSEDSRTNAGVYGDEKKLVPNVQAELDHPSNAREAHAPTH